MITASASLRLRYGDEVNPDGSYDASDTLAVMLARGSCRSYRDEAVQPGLCRLLCAAALASPTKSDLQQRDIVILQDPTVKAGFVDLVGAEAWVRGVPNVAVFCGNNRRQRQLHKLRGHAFVNDHLDAFFNATVDAAIALSAFVTAAEAVGLGCCAISAVRNEAAAVSGLLALPDHVFPVAGLAFGYPAADAPAISMRLPLSATVHQDRYTETDTEAIIADYDLRRQAQQPYSHQRAAEVFGTVDAYCWSEDKSRQYALPERQSYGAFIRSKGFNLT
ncbi:MAG: nitroreductase family protein [Pseudomonadota bacterium]